MAKTKLKVALDRHKGRNYALEKQRKLEKAAEKRKRDKRNEQEEADADSDKDDNDPIVLHTPATDDGEAPDWDTEEDDTDDGSEDEAAQLDASRLAESDSDSDDSDDGGGGDGNKASLANGVHANEEVDEEDEDEDIPLSDLASVASEDKGDIVPHQRLTINNTTALNAALKRFALPISTMPFSVHQTLATAAPVSIPDIDDDLNRELAFYQQALTAVQEARSLLKKEGVPFSRPTDFFAEMVKSDEHMGRVRQKMVDTAAGKRAAAEARKQRDLKKFGKAVQVEKQRERAKEKRETLDRINTLKRKRAGADLTATNEDDLFDVALEDAATSERREKAAKQQQRRETNGKPNAKRQKKDQKFGFGGKKRHSKSGDAMSSADMRGFSTKRMKADAFGGGGGGGRGGKAKGGAKRPGKSRRAKTH